MWERPCFTLCQGSGRRLLEGPEADNLKGSSPGLTALGLELVGIGDDDGEDGGAGGAAAGPGAALVVCAACTGARGRPYRLPLVADAARGLARAHGGHPCDSAPRRVAALTDGFVAALGCFGGIEAGAADMVVEVHVHAHARARAGPPQSQLHAAACLVEAAAEVRALRLASRL